MGKTLVSKGLGSTPGNGRPVPLSVRDQALDETPSGRLGFLLDMDGVIYRGDEPIAGAAALIRQLREDSIPFLFLTNNSASAPRDYVVKLHKMGIEVEEEHFYTCAMATVDFLRLQEPRGTAFV